MVHLTHLEVPPNDQRGPSERSSAASGAGETNLPWNIGGGGDGAAQNERLSVREQAEKNVAEAFGVQGSRKFVLVVLVGVIGGLCLSNAIDKWPRAGAGMTEGIEFSLSLCRLFLFLVSAWKLFTSPSPATDRGVIWLLALGSFV